MHNQAGRPGTPPHSQPRRSCRGQPVQVDQQGARQHLVRFSPACQAFISPSWDGVHRLLLAEASGARAAPAQQPALAAAAAPPGVAMANGTGQPALHPGTGAASASTGVPMATDPAAGEGMRPAPLPPATRCAVPSAARRLSLCLAWSTSCAPHAVPAPGHLSPLPQANTSQAECRRRVGHAHGAAARAAEAGQRAGRAGGGHDCV